MSFLSASGIHKAFGASVAVKRFDLEIAKGEFVTFLGPSGCGKTTMLRMIAGFEVPTRGTIKINGKDVTDLPPNKRNIGMVFQSYALFPNLTVAGNIGFGLRIAGKPPQEIKKRVREMLEMVKLPQFADRYPAQLSGGQQQRISLARALAPNPQILLLDEPLSALDARIRASLREEIRALQLELKITTIFVTHDQEEALSMSDRVVVMRDGEVEQIGAPKEIYNRPRTRFVASFVGTLNHLRAKIVDPATGAVEIEGQPAFTKSKLNGARPGDTQPMALRPESLQVTNAEGGANVLRGVVEDAAFHGAVVRVKLRLRETLLLVDVFNTGDGAAPERGQPLSVTFRAEDLIALQGE
jgi:putative spermidine/putrescine transport system ATP-binding protein